MRMAHVQAGAGQLEGGGDEDLAIIHVDLVRQPVAQRRPLERLFQLEVALGEEESGVGHQAGGVVDEGNEVGAAHLPRVGGIGQIRAILEIALPELIAVRFLKAPGATGKWAGSARHDAHPAQVPVEGGAGDGPWREQAFLLQNLQDRAHTARGQFLFQRNGSVEHVRGHGLHQSAVPTMARGQRLQPARVIEPPASGAASAPRAAAPYPASAWPTAPGGVQTPPPP